MPRDHHPQTGLNRDVATTVSVKGNAHPYRRARRRHTVQHNAVQREAQGVGLAAVNCDDPPLNRAVIAKAQHRPRDRMRAHRSQQNTDTNQQRCNGKGPCGFCQHICQGR